MDSYVFSIVNSSLSDNIANETFNFGSLNGVRGFFTNPSRADDCFIPFNSILSMTPYKIIGHGGERNITYEKVIEESGYFAVCYATYGHVADVATSINNNVVYQGNPLKFADYVPSLVTFLKLKQGDSVIINVTDTGSWSGTKNYISLVYLQ